MAGKHRQDPVKCTVCDGRGKVLIDTDGKDKRKVEEVPCNACNGTGQQP